MARLPPTPKRPPQPATPIELRDAIRAEALRLGFSTVGFAPASPVPDERRERLQQLDAFMAQGYQGDMVWLGDRTEARVDPSTLWREARTVVSLGLNYGPQADPRAVLAHRDRAAISVYAQGRDYHEVVKTKLKALGRHIWDTYRHEIKVFVDTAPLMEKPTAQTAGLGWQGKHTNLVSRDWGSWLFLGELLISAELPADTPETDHCGQCHACLDACPTNAFPAPYQLDARRCISYLTIEHEGPIDEELRPLLGNRIYGCDDCLAACPWNKFAQRTQELAFTPRAELDAPALADLATLDDATFRQRFSGAAIKRIGRERFIRNVAYALGNSGARESLPAVQQLLNDNSALVRDAARWAFWRLTGETHETGPDHPAGAGLRRHRLGADPDAGPDQGDRRQP